MTSAIWRQWKWCVGLAAVGFILAVISGCSSSATDAARSDADTASDAPAGESKSATASKPITLLPEKETPPPTFVRTDVSVVKYPDKSVYMKRSVKIYSDDTLVSHGPYVSYHQNGQKFEEGEYVDGKKQGKWHLYHENGKEAKTENYVDGKVDGQWTLFNPDGGKERDVSYHNGVRHGKWVYYDDDGNPSRQEEYDNDKLNGSVVIWFPGGKQKAMELNYKLGTPEGKQQQWYASGQLQRETSYKNGKLDGKITAWNEKGEKVEEMEYANGQRIDKGVAKGS